MAGHIDIPELAGVASLGVATLRARGSSEKRLRAKQLARPFWGIRAEGLADDLAGRARQYGPRLKPGQLIGGPAAAALLGLPLPTTVDDAPVTIVVPRGAYRPRTAGVESVSVLPERLVTWRVDSLPVTSPVLTLCLLARTLDLDALIVVADALMAPRDRYPLLRFARPAATPERLAAALTAWGTAPGSARLRAALEEARPGVDSPMETPTRCMLVRAGLPEPEVNGEIFDEGVLIAQPDLLYRDAKVAIEYDGEQHFLDPRQRAHDLERDERLRSLGWRVIRLSASMLAQPWKVVERVRAALAAASS
ncbi:DUF559 domain-containing protein [Agrococcus baldri]|nr:DUF559 domain-containing protein [Agrococcus baldri]